MKKLSTRTPTRKRAANLDLTARKAGATRGGIIAVLIGLLRPQPAQPARVPLTTPRG
jgi:hypothetical protein